MTYAHTSLTRHTAIDAWEHCNHTRKTELNRHLVHALEQPPIYYVVSPPGGWPATGTDTYVRVRVVRRVRADPSPRTDGLTSELLAAGRRGLVR